jgi:hypothetical protein
VSKSPIDWDALAERYPPALVSTLRELFSENEPFTISAQTLSLGTAYQGGQPTELLNQLCPPLTKESELQCGNCKNALTSEEAQADSCPYCNGQYADHGGVVVTEMFAYYLPRSRDVSWVLALHGMNTRGAWQEDFNWRVSTAYGRSVPVAIYKYGWVLSGAIWMPSLRREVKRLVEKIHKLKGHTKENGFGDVPDVIAHSLGTWLLGHALLWNPSLAVGRVVLTGSILRPDFDWLALTKNGQVEAVLNHYGAKDFWAGIAHYLIPDSGPSGRRGFDSNASIVQVRANSFGHSDFFSETHLPKVFKDTWQPFLVSPLSGLSVGSTNTIKPWHQAWWPFRATILSLVLLALYCALLGFGFACLVLGFCQVLRWF